ncbi:MAG: LysR substrate-binding domain-containing protein [Myxococcota bacterium]
MKGRPEQLGKAAVFAAVVREGSFSAGAKAMGLARSTASEHVAALESALGVRLLERTTRTLRLTEEGELLFDRIDRTLRAWEEARAALEERSGEPAGTLRITSPGGLASALVAPTCGELVAAHARVSVELIVDDRLRDLISEGIDVAIRMAPLQDSSLVCRKLGSTYSILVDAPGAPSTTPAKDPERQLEAIRERPWVGHPAVPRPTVTLHDAKGQAHAVRPNYRTEGSNSEGQLSLAAHGCGLALVPELLVRQPIEQGRLGHAFADWRGREIPIYAVYSRTRFTPPRVARFLDLLTQHLDALR